MDRLNENIKLQTVIHQMYGKRPQIIFHKDNVHTYCSCSFVGDLNIITISKGEMECNFPRCIYEAFYQLNQMFLNT